MIRLKFLHIQNNIKKYIMNMFASNERERTCNKAFSFGWNSSSYTVLGVMSGGFGIMYESE